MQTVKQFSCLTIFPSGGGSGHCSHFKTLFRREKTLFNGENSPKNDCKEKTVEKLSTIDSGVRQHSAFLFPSGDFSLDYHPYQADAGEKLALVLADGWQSRIYISPMGTTFREFESSYKALAHSE